MSLGLLSGSLKQQVDDGTGDYEWKKRNFVFDLDKGDFRSKEDGSRPIPLVGALYAKAWSISSPAVGYGFDIVWSDGNIMSFIASEQADCTAWVNGVNASIKFNSDAGVGQQESDLIDTILDKNIKNTNNLPSAVSRSREKVGGNANDKPPRPASGNGTGVRRGRGRDDSIGDNAGNGNNNGNNGGNNSRGESPISDMSDTNMHTMNHHRKLHRSSDNNGAGNINLNASSIHTVGSDHSHFVPPNSSNGGNGGNTSGHYAHAKHPTTTTSSSTHDNINNNTSHTDMHATSNTSTREDDLEMENHRLQQKCMRLHSKAERESMDAQIAREMLEKLQAEYDARSTQHGRDLQAAEEKEKLAIMQARAEVEMQILKATNENAVFHADAMKAEKEQASREMQCLKEDLAAERKRFAALLKEETAGRKRAEDHEVGLQQEITSLKEANQRCTAEVNKLHKQQRQDQAHWQRERELLRQESEDFTAKVEREREDQANKAQIALRSKIAELQLKFDSRVKEAEASIAETCRQEHEGLRLRDVAVLEKRYEQEIGQVRTVERQARAREVEALKGVFRGNERQTAEDLAQLEKLHTERVKRLERQVEALQAKVHVAEAVAQDATTLANQGSVEVRKQAAAHVEQATAATKRAEKLAKELERCHRDLQEARVRESTYRDQLSRSLDDNRLQRAEVLEAKKQATDSAAECFHYRKMVQEQGTEKSESALVIARNEIAFLEKEVSRLRDDNHALLANVHKHEKLLYGQPHEVAPKGTLRRAHTPTRGTTAGNASTPTRSRSPSTRTSPRHLSSGSAAAASPISHAHAHVDSTPGRSFSAPRPTAPAPSSTSTSSNNYVMGASMSRRGTPMRATASASHFSFLENESVEGAAAAASRSYASGISLLHGHGGKESGTGKTTTSSSSSSSSSSRSSSKAAAAAPSPAPAARKSRKGRTVGTFGTGKTGRLGK